MCTYVTKKIDLRGSGKLEGTWTSLTDALVYYDHPVHLGETHSLNIDFRNPALGPSGRVPVELSAESARRLAHAILEILDSAEIPAEPAGASSLPDPE